MYFISYSTNDYQIGHEIIDTHPVVWALKKKEETNRDHIITFYIKLTQAEQKTINDYLKTKNNDELV